MIEWGRGAKNGQNCREQNRAADVYTITGRVVAHREIQYLQPTQQLVGRKQDKEMAKVRLNPIMLQIRGAVGDLVFKRYGDELILARNPDREGIELTEAQKAHRKRFQQAVQYARQALAEPAKLALYQARAKATGKPTISVPVGDFLNLPSVGNVDLSGYAGAAGDKISFQAEDDFSVVSAQVSITQSDGTPIESGNAMQTAPNSAEWSYTATKAVAPGTHVRITATARDLPGGEGSQQVEKDL
jgi:hypothetical protein